jgi:APA family basic amino acid/polyamine antiporter
MKRKSSRLTPLLQIGISMAGPDSTHSDATSSRPLGFWALTALVVGSMIGSGVFLLPASLAPYGAASLLGWGATLCGALLLALVYARLSREKPLQGGSYAYTREAFGDLPAFVVGWAYWVSMMCGNGALAVAFAGSLGAVFPATIATPGRAAATALGALWFCTAVNLFGGVRGSGRMQMLWTVLKLLPLVLFGAIAVWYVEPASYHPFNPTGAPLLSVATATAALTLWAFQGLEVATIPAASIRDPARTIPRATLAGMLIAGLVTVLVCTVVLGLLPSAQLQHSAAPMADAAEILWGPWARIAVGAVAAVSVFGALNGWVLLQAQVPLAAADDGLFPRFFARVDKRGTPWLGLLLSSGIATAIAASNYSGSLVELFTFSILLSTAATLLPYCFSVAALLRQGRRIGALWQLVAVAALAYSLWALFGTGGEALLWGAGLILAGLPLYFWRKRKG